MHLSWAAWVFSCALGGALLLGIRDGCRIKLPFYHDCFRPPHCKSDPKLARDHPLRFCVTEFSPAARHIERCVLNHANEALGLKWPRLGPCLLHSCPSKRKIRRPAVLFPYRENGISSSRKPSKCPHFW